MSVLNSPFEEYCAWSNLYAAVFNASQSIESIIMVSNVDINGIYQKYTDTTSGTAKAEKPNTI